MTEYRETFLIGYLNDCQNQDLLNNPEGLRRLVRTAAKKSNTTVIRTHADKYPGQGVTASATIGDSVILVQGWPERMYALAIIHSSYSSMKSEEGMNYIVRRLQSGRAVIKRIKGYKLPPVVE